MNRASPRLRYAKSSIKKDIGRRVRRYRTDRKITQRELAGTYTKAYISAIENGTIWPSVPMLYEMAERLGVPVSALLEDSG